VLSDEQLLASAVIPQPSGTLAMSFTILSLTSVWLTFAPASSLGSVEVQEVFVQRVDTVE
jgi:hypothetical protein